MIVLLIILILLICGCCCCGYYFYNKRVIEHFNLPEKAKDDFTKIQNIYISFEKNKQLIDLLNRFLENDVTLDISENIKELLTIKRDVLVNYIDFYTRKVREDNDIYKNKFESFFTERENEFKRLVLERLLQNGIDKDKAKKKSENARNLIMNDLKIEVKLDDEYIINALNVNVKNILGNKNFNTEYGEKINTLDDMKEKEQTFIKSKDVSGLTTKKDVQQSVLKFKEEDISVCPNFENYKKALKRPMCYKHSDCNAVNGNGKNICDTDGKCRCIGGGSGHFCHLGKVNYKETRLMTNQEIDEFKKEYHPNMTLQDYKNWLELFDTSEYKRLSLRHQENIKKMRENKLLLQDIPLHPSQKKITAEEYFKKLYKVVKTDYSKAQKAPGNLLGYNIGDYGEYISSDKIGQLPVIDFDNEKASAEYLDSRLRSKMTKKK